MSDSTLIWSRENIDAMIQSVAEYWHLSPSQILGKSRRRIVCEARMVAICIARVKTRMSLEELGTIFDKDHTSILHSINALHEHCEKDPSFKAIITKDWPAALSAVTSADAERWNEARRTENTKRLIALQGRAEGK